jgi:hypothetical protein
MAVLPHLASELQRRDRRRCRYDYRYGYSDDCYSPWYSYGRWVLLGAIILATFLIFLLFSCITARRRRRMGMQPFRGTGWAAQGGPFWAAQQQQQQQQQQQPHHQGWQQPPPMYGQQNQDGTYYGNQGEYKPYPGQQNGVEVQQPSPAYVPPPAAATTTVGGDNIYAPPPGPPPTHTKAAL